MHRVRIELENVKRFKRKRRETEKMRIEPTKVGEEKRRDVGIGIGWVQERQQKVYLLIKVNLNNNYLHNLPKLIQQ